MIQYEVYVVFIGSVVAMQVTPGPNTLVVVSNGIYGGYKQALLYAAGVTAAGLVQVPIIVLG
ncbi:MAG: LysE family transporter, partial [Gammaproteobacteria bacterium]